MKQKLSILFGLFLVLSPSLAAQQTHNDPRTASGESPSHPELPMPTVWKSTNLPAEPIFGNVVCGPHLSLYFREQEKLQNPLQSPVTGLTMNGESSTFDLKNIPDLHGHVSVFAFGVDAGGNIYAIAKGEEDPASYLAVYDRQGRYVGKVSLRDSVRASFLVPVNNTRFLLGGTTIPRSKSENPRAVTALIDSQGNKLRSLAAPEDDQAGAALPDSGRFFNPSVELGAARLGSDGDVYLFKASPIPRVQVLDPQGNPLRDFLLSPPAKGAQAFDFFLLGNSLVAVYQLEQPVNGEQQLVEIYSAATGEPTATYVKRAPGILACTEGATWSSSNPPLTSTMRWAKCPCIKSGRALRELWGSGRTARAGLTWPAAIDRVGIRQQPAVARLPRVHAHACPRSLHWRVLQAAAAWLQ